ncbi:MAG: hypothetical protein EAZ08_12740 [Cytophagales bacterium]|nr:MAG: hypothetical protein EAZ08_12740 [Cytophagales bacterium]
MSFKEKLPTCDSYFFYYLRSCSHHINAKRQKASNFFRFWAKQNNLVNEKYYKRGSKRKNKIISRKV